MEKTAGDIILSAAFADEHHGNGGDVRFSFCVADAKLPSFRFLAPSRDGGEDRLLLQLLPPGLLRWGGRDEACVPALYRALWLLLLCSGNPRPAPGCDYIFVVGLGGTSTVTGSVGRNGHVVWCGQGVDNDIEYVRLESDGTIYVEGVATDEVARVRAALEAWADRVLDVLCPVEIRP